MTPEQFIYWLKGYLESLPDGKDKLHIQKTIDQVLKDNDASSTAKPPAGVLHRANEYEKKINPRSEVKIPHWWSTPTTTVDPLQNPQKQSTLSALTPIDTPNEKIILND